VGGDTLDLLRWRRDRDSSDVIDQRAARPGAGGRMPFPFPGGLKAGGGLGVAGLVIFLLITLIGGGGSGFSVDNQFGDAVEAPARGAIPADQDPDRDLKDFSVYVFNNSQRSWEDAFRQQGKPYEHAKLVLYRGGVSSGCGDASSAVGPFYCPADRRVYLDLSFYRDMSQQLGADGDFAWAYVIAHEMGHHVQQQLGTSDEVRRLQGEDGTKANELSVRLELQADCYAGVWGNSVYRAGDLEEGDVDEAVTASEAVGDDRLQRRATGSVDPDTFTHGTSAQRANWFETGQQGGEPTDCDTFSADSL
jgi:predicted metalloprotease